MDNLILFTEPPSFVSFAFKSFLSSGINLYLPCAKTSDPSITCAIHFAYTVSPDILPD